MKKVAVLIADVFDERELIYPYYRLQDAGYEVHLVGAKAGETYHSKAGVTEVSTHAAKDIKAEDYAGVVIPGGFSPDHMRRDPATVNFVRQMDQLKKPIGAICHGPWMLASAVDLKGKKATSYFSIKDDIVNAGAQYLDQAVVVDGHIITSRTPKDMVEFMQAVIKAIN